MQFLKKKFERTEEKTMAEHIKRETLINHLDACMDTIWKPEIVALKCFVEGIPAADVAPVRHGRWVMSSDRPDTIICTCCDNAFDVWKADIKRHHYCPNCGAKMDARRLGGEEND